MTWKQLTERDRREWKLSVIDPHDRDTWRSGVRSAMRAASRFLERGPLLWIWPLYLHVNQKSDDDDDDDDDDEPIKLQKSRKQNLHLQNFKECFIQAIFH